MLHLDSIFKSMFPIVQNCYHKLIGIVHILIVYVFIYKCKMLLILLLLYFVLLCASVLLCQPEFLLRGNEKGIS